MTVNPAAVTAAGVVLAAFLALLGAMVGHLWARVHSLERDQVEIRRVNNLLWRWGRDLVDLYYKHRTVDAPPPPEPPKLG